MVKFKGKSKCPVCGKEGYGPYVKKVYRKLKNGQRKTYEYEYFAHKTERGIKWCYIGRRRAKGLDVGVEEKVSQLRFETGTPRTFLEDFFSSLSCRYYSTLGLLEEKRSEEWKALMREFLRILVGVREELKDAAHGMRILSQSFEHLIKLFEILNNYIRKIKELIEEG